MSDGRARLLRLFEHRVLRHHGLDAFILLVLKGRVRGLTKSQLSKGVKSDGSDGGSVSLPARSSS